MPNLNDQRFIGKDAETHAMGIVIIIIGHTQLCFNMFPLWSYASAAAAAAAVPVTTRQPATDHHHHGDTQ